MIMQRVTNVIDEDANEQGTQWQATEYVEGVGKVELCKDKPVNNPLTWLEWYQAMDESGNVYWYQEDL